MISILPEDDLDTQYYSPDFGSLTQVIGTVEDKPALPPECHNSEPVNAERAWKAVEDLCRGNG